MPRRRNAHIKNDTLTKAERIFVTEMTRDGNKTRAYRAAFPDVTYGTAKTRGAQLAQRPDIAGEIAAARDASCRRLGMSAENVLREHRYIAFADILGLFDESGNLRHPRDIPEPLRRAVQSVEVSRERVVARAVTTARTEEGGTKATTKTTTHTYESLVKVRLWNKTESLNMLAKQLGLKSSLPPLDQLLALLPRTVAEPLRAYLTAPDTADAPQRNGYHPPMTTE